MSPARKLPPYGKQLMARRMAGEVPREVIVSLSWKLGAAFTRIVIPEDTAVDDLDLRALAGLDVTVVHHAEDAHRVPAVADAILAVRPRLVCACNVDVPSATIIGGPAA
jgi:hypothetical protein